MRRPTAVILPIVFVAILATSIHRASADIIKFVPTGAAGIGLLQGNISPATGEQGTGGMGALGIEFNTDNNLLRVHLEWGSDFGYTDMSSDVLKLHLHGPTASSGTAAYGEMAPLLIVLNTSTSFNASASGGGVNDIFFINPSDVQPLMDGRMYLNVHLSNADTGVIRGYLNAVPEPGSTLVFAALAGLSAFRRKRSR